MPKPAPKYDANDQNLLAHLKAAKEYQTLIERHAESIGEAPSIIWAIGSRESGWGVGFGYKPQGPSGTGDWTPRTNRKPFRSSPMPPDGLGFGRGLMQIDYDSHEFARTGDWRNPDANIRYGCLVLKRARNWLGGKGVTGLLLFRAGIAAYNCGAGSVLKALRQWNDPDRYTSHGNYSADVLARAQWVRNKGWM